MQPSNRLLEVHSRELRLILPVLLGLFACATIPSHVDAEDSPPHIIVLLADDLGWGDLGYHGSEIATPNLDELARRGTRLNQFYVQPVCSPTRGALLTGRYPIRLGLQHGVVRPWAMHGLPVNERTLPQALRGVGYTTAIVGKWHLGHNRDDFLPTRRGFDIQYGHYNGNLDYFTHLRDGGHDWHRNDQRSDDDGYATDLIGAEAVRVLETHDPQRPLFLYVPFNAPHTPLQAPESYLALYEDWPDRQRAIYAAMVTCMDDAIGTIVEALDDNGYARSNTLIFFCSDNGGVPRLGSNGPFRAGKGTLYEGGVRAPAIVVLDQVVEASSENNQMLHVTDLYPTLLRLAGASLGQLRPLDGKDIWPVIVEGDESPHEVMLHNVTPFSGALRMGDWKLIRNGSVQANSTRRPREETWELFNIAEDPAEQNNLYEEHPQIAIEMTKKLAEFAASAAAPVILTRPPDDFESPEVWGETGR